ncbi:MAG: hypothetical protein A3F10_00325 [Coxiella sp. RIFCSPHIGHO2_12_FULL_42_15]|nr:MAG: hypothetical protein A3F10_00325 [Coxiella sp. RIFCSPHIGHO2_12_FULL_42_15]
MSLCLIEKQRILSAAQQFGTPFYGYHKSELQATAQRLKIHLPSQIEVFYSLKANPNIAICSILRSAGIHAEVCSFYEIEAALKSGFDPKNIIFLGPAKSDIELITCLQIGIYAIICESLHELKRISQHAKTLNKIARIALRINPSHISMSALLKMGGKPSQFGIDEEIIFENKEYILHMPNIQLVGIHVYHGTRILNASTISENTEYILSLADRIQEEWGLIFEMIDIGGGFGVPYFENEESLDLPILKSSFFIMIEKYLKKYLNARIILESGRYLVAESGFLISKIIDIKKSKGELFVITDGGTHCHMPAVGIGGIVRKNFPIEIISNSTKLNNTHEIYNITGPLCTPGDLLAKQICLPKLEINDLIVVKNSGAYGPTASPVMFLSHGFPAEVLFSSDHIYCIRDRFGYEEFFNKQSIIY